MEKPCRRESRACNRCAWTLTRPCSSCAAWGVKCGTKRSVSETSGTDTKSCASAASALNTPAVPRGGGGAAVLGVRKAGMVFTCQDNMCATRVTQAATALAEPSHHHTSLPRLVAVAASSVHALPLATQQHALGGRVLRRRTRARLGHRVRLDRRGRPGLLAGGRIRRPRGRRSGRRVGTCPGPEGWCRRRTRRPESRPPRA